MSDKVLQYELDSLAGFLKICRSYYENTKDSSFLNDNCRYLRIVLLHLLTSDSGFAAMEAILTLVENESQSSWSEDWEFISYYNWTGTAGSLSPPVKNGGNGDLRKANGLVSSSHRPSDDLCVFSTYKNSTEFLVSSTNLSRLYYF